MTSLSLRRAAAIALLIGSAALAACGSTARTEGTGEYVDDTVITTKTKAALFNEPTLKSTEIGVETYKGVVPFLMSDFARIILLVAFPLLGLLVGFIALSVLLPIFQLIHVFKR